MAFLTATIARREVERAARTADRSAQLVLDVVRMAEGRLENRPLELAVAPDDLEELLRTAAGDELMLVFERGSLADATAAPEVEAHALPRRAVLFTVLAATPLAAPAVAAAAATGSAPAVTVGGASVVVEHRAPPPVDAPQDSPFEPSTVDAVAAAAAVLAITAAGFASGSRRGPSRAA